MVKIKELQNLVEKLDIDELLKFFDFEFRKIQFYD